MMEETKEMRKLPYLEPVNVCSLTTVRTVFQPVDHPQIFFIKTRFHWQVVMDTTQDEDPSLLNFTNKHVKVIKEVSLPMKHIDII